VQGTVFDEQTSMPVANAMVFINQTTKGQKTDSSGFFSINDVNENQFELVVYAAGYEPSVLNFTKDLVNKRIKFQLHKLSKTVEKAETLPTDKNKFGNRFFYGILRFRH